MTVVTFKYIVIYPDRRYRVAANIRVVWRNYFESMPVSIAPAATLEGRTALWALKNRPNSQEATERVVSSVLGIVVLTLREPHLSAPFALSRERLTSIMRQQYERQWSLFCCSHPHPANDELERIRQAIDYWLRQIQSDGEVCSKEIEASPVWVLLREWPDTRDTFLKEWTPDALRHRISSYIVVLIEWTAQS